MNKKRILFVDHSFHGTTRSSDFFVALLRERFYVDELDISPADESHLEKILSLDVKLYNAIVLWQIDYLSCHFIDLGIPTIVCPMFDASGSLMDLHWESMKGCMIICFSLELYWKVSRANSSCLYLRYFPPAPYADQSPSLDQTSSKTSGLNVFFWERLPKSSINTKRVAHLLQNLQINSIHIHKVPDPGQETAPDINEELPENYQTSTWFEDKDELYKKIHAADIVIAPRYSEGIGIAFLEAMNMGCCVVAQDSPTHNEYIENGVNGILFNFDDPDMTLNILQADITSMAKRAKDDGQRWHSAWIEHYSRLALERIEVYINDFVPQLYRSQSVSCISNLQDMMCAHLDWDRYWNFLKDRIARVDLHTSLSACQELETGKRYMEAISIMSELCEEMPEVGIYSELKQMLIERSQLEAEIRNHSVD